MPDVDAAPAVRLGAVNVGTPTLLGELDGERVWSGIRKRPVASDERLWLSWLDLAGDGQADLDVHGGPDKAVYAYPSEHLASWAGELGETLGDAPFGENLSTIGVLEQDVGIGDVWQMGIGHAPGDPATLAVLQAHDVSGARRRRAPLASVWANGLVPPRPRTRRGASDGSAPAGCIWRTSVPSAVGGGHSIDVGVRPRPSRRTRRGSLSHHGPASTWRARPARRTRDS